MTNPKHLEILKYGAVAWNLWRKEHPEVRPAFSKADLRGTNLSRADLFAADFSEADLRGVDLRRTDLIGADFSEADLSEANLCEADLSGAIGLTQEQVDSTNGDGSTRLPGHIRHPAHWKKN